MSKETTEQSPQLISEGESASSEVLTDIEHIVEDNLLSFLGNSPYLDLPWVKALIVLAAVILVALFVKLVLFVVLKKITDKTRNDLDNKIIIKLQSPIFWSLILLGISLALKLVGLSAGALELSRKIILTLFFVLWMMKIISIVKMVLHSSAHADKQKKFVSKQTLPLMLNISVVVILVIFIYMIMSTWNVNMTAFLASAGVLGVAIGFAAKDTLANLISGVLILADQPYKIGDFVVLESGERGEITHIGIRSTRMRTRDDVEVTVPNSIMGNTTIVNESGGPYEKFRIRIGIGVAYGTDVDRMRDILLKVAAENENICKEPEPRVRMRNFGASSLDFELLCWVPTPVLRGLATDQLYETIYKEFNAAGIEIPYQQLDLRIKENLE